jgi:hypothetical protein
MCMCMAVEVIDLGNFMYYKVERSNSLLIIHINPLGFVFDSVLH